MKTISDWLDRKLSRVTTSGDTIREVDGLRFVAMMMVFFHHLLGLYAIRSDRWGWISFPEDWARVAEASGAARWMAPGYMGVELFFVISGFVLALPFARHRLMGGTPVSLAAYYKRRLWRMEPPYVIAVLVFFAAKILMHANWRELLPNVLATLFYVHGFVFDAPSALETVFWSLEIEVQFYLLAPLLAGLFLARGRRWWLAGTILLWSVGVAQLWDGAHRYRLGLVLYLPYFLAGMLLADLYLTGKRWRSPYGDLAGVAIAAWLYLGAPLVGVDSRTWHWPMAIAAMYAAIYNGKYLPRFLTLRPVYLLGGMCYTVYMYHTNLLHLLGRLTFQQFLWLPVEWDLALQALLLTAPILAVCAVLFVLLEKPFMIRRTWQKRKMSESTSKTVC